MTTTRVRYREGQTLYCDDLLEEQAYRIAMRRRHNLAQHSWGIVRGLQLNSVTGRFELEPGLAIDGFGRELIVPESVYFTCDGLGSSESVDVWLLYGLVPVSYPRRGRETCGPGRHSRWREVANLRLKLANDNIDPRRPVEVSSGDFGLKALCSLAEDPNREWPVYLGRFDAQGKVVESRRRCRPYAGLVGESVTSPYGRVRMQVGAETVGDRRRFAIGLKDENDEFQDRLVIDREGNTSHYGDAVLHGDLKIEKFPESASERDPCVTWPNSSGTQKVPPPPGIELHPLAAVPEKAAPWSIYRAEISNDEEQKQGLPLHQLRFEIGNPGDKGDPSRFLFAIGHNRGFAFEPCLSVSADCTVIVNGTLHVGGQVIEGPIQADPDDPAFRDAVQEQWMLAAGETSGKTVDAFLQSARLAVSVSVDEPAFVGTALEYSIVAENVGGLPITHITLYATISIQQGVDEPETLDERTRIGPETLEPGEKHVFGGICEPTKAGKLYVNAMVSGVGPTAKSVSSDPVVKTVSVNEPSR